MNWQDWNEGPSGKKQHKKGGHPWLTNSQEPLKCLISVGFKRSWALCEKREINGSSTSISTSYGNLAKLNPKDNQPTFLRGHLVGDEALQCGGTGSS